MNASLISRLSEPLIVLSLLLVLGCFRSGMRPESMVIFLISVFGFVVLPVTLFRFWLVKNKKADWDISSRRKRFVPLLVVSVILWAALQLVGLLGNSFLTDMFFSFFVWVLGFFLITLFWKISGHTGIITLSSLMLIDWYGWQFWPILLVVPLVAWARVVGKNHTLAQAIGGIFYSLLLFGILNS